MKIFKSVLFICLFFFLVIPACMKNTVTVDYAGTHASLFVTVPKPIVKRGEPFVVSTNAQDSSTLVKWAIRPSDSTVIIPYGSDAIVYINLPGTYLISANFYSLSDTVRSYDSSHSTIIVNDSLYSVPPVVSGYDTVPLAGGELTIIPISTSGALQFLVKTAKNYNCTSYISAIGFWQYTLIPESTINFYFDSATVAISKADCGGAQNPATINIPVIPLSNGSHPIEAVLTQNPQAYFQGSVMVTDSNYTFTWTYTSGVIISPLQIKKN